MGWGLSFKPMLYFELQFETAQMTLSVNAEDGKEVAVLFNGMTEANKTYQLVFNTQDLPAGTYYAVLRKADGSQQSMPVLVVK